MDGKFLKNRNGKWVTLSMSVLAATLVLINQQETILAEETTLDHSTALPESQINVENHNALYSEEAVQESAESTIVDHEENISEITQTSEFTEGDSQNVEGQAELEITANEYVGISPESSVAEHDQNLNVEQSEAVVTNALNTYTPEEFIDRIGESARKIAEENDLYASVMIAQAALESGWGNSNLAQSPSNNLFGIKGEYQGNSTNIKTLEDNGLGEYSEIDADFRSYDSPDASLNDYARFLTGQDTAWREEFYKGVRRSVASSYQDATVHLTGTYATATNYNDRLNRIIDKYDLTQFDSPVEDFQEVNQQTIKQTSLAPMINVQSGDTLYSIAQNNNLTVDQLQKLNNLNDTMIHPGQQLIVSEKQLSSNSVMTQARTVKAPSSHVTVQAGDSLYRIAKNNNLTVEQLRQYNNIVGDLIHPGQRLKVKPDHTIKPVEKPQETNRPNNNSTKTVTVQRGDTLYRLAINNNMSVQELRQLNNLSGNIIVPGQTLMVKGNQFNTKPTEKPADTNKPNNSTPSTITVKPGDSLYRIALTNNMTVEQLRLLNNLTGNIIHPGQQLKLKATPTTPSKPVEKPQEKPTTPPVTQQYTVKNGDTLYKIATANGMTVNQLIQLNKLTSNIIVSGQKLILANHSGTLPNHPQPDLPTYTGNNLPDLTKANSTIVNYDVKLNGKVEPFRTTLSTSGKTVSVVNYFGNKYTVTRELTHGGNKFLELSSNGNIQGYVPASAAVQVPQNVRTVYLDAGHGGSETGAYSFGTAEKDLNMAISNRLADLLRGQGYHVYETRRTDKAVSLTERSKATNEIMPDIFVSIHHNAMARAGSARGIEVLYHDPRIDEPNYMTMEHHKGTNIIPEGRRLGQSLQTGLVNATNGINRGIRPQNLHVTRVTDVPAALVELGFQDNWHDYQLLTNPTYQNKLIQGLVNGINAYFAGIK
ncbi:LysM peptidoglycan-binding domain-containing protein [Aerococcaceae bacterium DSM 111020]|nr:LysM peptidoglycan-binding domain-containing protein [Aerococcaceae bacterium DSM 111020]